jgi:hypothetical protein
MSTGGIFKLLNNNAHHDEHLLALDLLSKRMKSIREIKEDNIENAIASNNIKIIQLTNLKNSENSIDNINKLNVVINNLRDKNELLKKVDMMPKSSDILKTHKIFILSEYKPFISMGFEYSKTAISIKPVVGGRAVFGIPNYGDFFSDMVLHLKLVGLEPINSNNKVRYCEYLGHRLLNNVSFKSYGRVLDSYGSEDYNIHYQYNVSQDKKKSWKRCVGQEIPTKAYITSDPLYQDYREYKKILNGNQTLKSSHPSVDLFMPLLFWFKDPKLAVPNKHIPFDNVTIELDLGKKEDIASCADYAGDGGLFTTPVIEECVLYTNHIFIDSSIMDILMHKIDVTMIYTHSTSEHILNQPYGSISLNYLSSPIVDIIIAFKPEENISGPNNSSNWGLNKKLIEKTLASPIIYDLAGTPTLGTTSIKYNEEIDVINSLSLVADDIPLYDRLHSKFYSAYMPYQYGNTISPADDGSYMMNLSFYPDQYQPTTYVNTEKVKEIRLKYESDIISSTNVVTAYISSKTINFLNYDDFTLQFY